MEEEVNGMILLIADMLELAKYESGTYKMQQEPFEIGHAIERVCGKLATELADKRLRLSTRLAQAEVVANRHRIEQVLVNFLTNAIRYTPEGESILVTAAEEADSVKVSMENRGVHIPEAQLEKVWDRFYRGEPSRNPLTGGTGLGLAIAKKYWSCTVCPLAWRIRRMGFYFTFICANKRRTSVLRFFNLY
ncbi:hypothetical protein HMSSN036_15900 [Paenibacillus macerans]|nr:hypothetical protein HMSSN036_15900 [Paenibacillus macerans]